jgi:VCBS repeat-containing protein
MSGQDLQNIMDNVPGWEAAEKREDGEMTADKDGYWIYRVSALGEQDGLKVMQNYFVVAAPDGSQTILAFTMKQGAVDKLGTRDLELARGIEFIEKAKKDGK